MKNLNFAAQAQYFGSYDVVVVGGGPAGTAACIASARGGAKTLLVESSGCMGGQATNGGLPFWLGARAQTADGLKDVVGGIYAELRDNMIAEGTAVGQGRSLPQDGKLLKIGITDDEVMFDVEGGKWLHEQLAIKAGVEILYFTTMLAPKVKDKTIEGLFLVNKNGLCYVDAKVVIDCSGDADVVYRAGFDTLKGDRDTGAVCPATLVWHVEDVDIDAVAEYLNNGGDKRFRALVAELAEKGIWQWEVDFVNFFPMVKKGVVMINGQPQINIDGTDARSLTKAMIKGRQNAVDYLNKIMRPYLPGFKDARIRYVASYIGIRETRRIVGEYTLTTEDIVYGRDFDDIIALSGYHFDLGKPVKRSDGTWMIIQPLHQNVNSGQTQPMKKAGKGFVEIPFRCLIPKGAKNLLAAGRCISTDDQALGPVRVMAPCFAMGQAAGTAAAITVAENIDVQQLDPTILRKTLVSQHAILEPK